MTDREALERYEQTLCHIANLSPQAAGAPADTLQHAQDVARGVLRSTRDAQQWKRDALERYLTVTPGDPDVPA